MKVSNCCYAIFRIGWKEDGMICSSCKEHCNVEEAFECENVRVSFADDGCWVNVFCESGAEQSLALEESEMLFLYNALGEYFNKN